MSKHFSLAQPRAVLASEPDLSPLHKKAVDMALRWAWGQLLAASEAALTSGDEEAITTALESQLGRMQDGQRVAPAIKDFEHPVRGAKQVSADGRNEKQPDLTFRPPSRAYPTISNSMAWGYFVECKLIQHGHSSRTVDSYSKEGVRRFASGEYAARMPSGMMLAFVRGDDKPQATLAPLLPLHGAPEIVAGDAPDQCKTLHPRTQLTNPCVDIELRHLWLAVPTQACA